MFGILLGLCAALSQSLSYICSRRYTHLHGGGSVRLLTLSHLWMGAFCLPAMLLLWPKDMPPLSQYAVPLVATSLFYFAGQAGLFFALRHTEASRVSPLLALKLIQLALVSYFALHVPINIWQWAAIALALFGAGMLNWSGGSIPTKAILWLLFTCATYSLSDIYIGILIEAMKPLPPLTASVIGSAISYFFCGLVALPLLPWHWRASKSEWLDALPFAVAWLVAMVFLFTCFSQIGVIFGNIIQSTRGIMSILLGVFLAWRGALHLESKVERGVLLRRIFAASLTIAAIVIYQLMRTPA